MILIFGKHGQLAQSFQMTLPKDLEGQTIFYSSLDADFQKPNLLAGFLDHCSPEVVIICSAYTQVDQAETDREVCELINFKAPREIARWCAQNDCLLIHFSTDYVFSGVKSSAWVESDVPQPLNWYGETKWEGEMAIQDTHCRHLIFRTSWVFSEFGRNFVKTMLKLGREKETLRVVSDQIGSPTYAPAVAQVVWDVVRKYLETKKVKNGLYHLSGIGSTSWSDFAEAIFSQAKKIEHLDFQLKVAKVEKILTADYQTIAARPLNSVLDQSKVQKELGIIMPTWQDSLDLCLRKLGAT